MKEVLKKVLFWNKVSLENKNHIRKLLGMKTTRITRKPKPKPKPKNNYASLFDNFSVFRANLSHIEVGLYFAGTMGNIYQIEQWVGVLKTLEKEKSIVLLIRDKKVFTFLSKNTDFTLVYCYRIEDVLSFYEKNNLKCILYVNQGFKNFQSLIIGNALHVHINHGESDKTSTFSNQAKAYDYVFVASDAGYMKYKNNLIKADMSKFIKVGRPQLEHIEKIEPFDTTYIEPIIVDSSVENNEEVEEKSLQTPIVDNRERKVILYAPTWEATHDSMNFTSLNDYGLTIIESLLDNLDYYVVYKPHPNTGSRDTVVKTINNKIKKLINDSNNRGVVIDSGDINSIYPHIDLAIFDNSAVAIDYLIVDKPMIMTDMFYRMKNYNKPIISKAAKLIKKDDAKDIISIIEDELKNDNLNIQRNKIKKYFLGNYDYANKESTKLFISKIVDICDERDNLFKELENNREENNAI